MTKRSCLSKWKLALLFTVFMNVAFADGEAERTWQNRYDTHLSSTDPLPAEAQDYARSQHYVFVAGIMSDISRPHFKNSTKALAAIGVRPEQIDRLFPPSASSVEDDSRALYEQIQKIASNNASRKLTLVGHSKGGAALLAMAIKHPRFILDHVDNIVLVQASIGGSPLATAYIGKEIPDPRSLPWLDRMVFWGARGAVRHTRRWFARGVLSLTPEHAQRYWHRLMEKHPDSAALVGNRIFYLRTAKGPSKSFGIRRATHLYLQQVAGPNDDSVPLSSQKLEGIGIDLGSLEATHNDFISNVPFATRTSKRRGRAMMNLLIDHLSSRSCGDELKSLADESQN